MAKGFDFVSNPNEGGMANFFWRENILNDLKKFREIDANFNTLITRTQIHATHTKHTHTKTRTHTQAHTHAHTHTHTHTQVAGLDFVCSFHPPALEHTAMR